MIICFICLIFVELLNCGFANLLKCKIDKLLKFLFFYFVYQTKVPTVPAAKDANAFLPLY